MKRSLLSYRLLFVVALVILIADQASKLYIVEELPVGTYFKLSPLPPIEVIPNFFYVVHITNEGAAWGMFDGYTEILGLLGLVAIFAIFYYRKVIGLERTIYQLSFGLLIGGIIGNMIDRFAYGHVVDFFDFHFGSYRYPSFNIADCGITVGVTLYVIASLMDGWKERKQSNPSPLS